MTLDVTSLLGVLPVTAREITRDETSTSWRKVKLRLSVSRSSAPSPESVHEDLPDYEDAPEASSHANDQGGAEEDEESEDEDELEDDNKVASETEHTRDTDPTPQHIPSALGLDFTSPIDLTQEDQQALVLSQLAGIDLRDSKDRDSSSETRLREAEAFIASAVLSTQSPTPSPPDEPSREHHDIQSTNMTVRRVGRYETIYSLSNPDGSDDEGYFEISRPGIARWSPSASTLATTKHPRAPVHRELSLHPRLPSFLSFLFVIPRYCTPLRGSRRMGMGVGGWRGLLRRGWGGVWGMWNEEVVLLSGCGVEGWEGRWRGEPVRGLGEVAGEKVEDGWCWRCRRTVRTQLHP